MLLFLTGSAAAFRWTYCPSTPLPWFSIRDLIFQLVVTPALLLPLLAGLLWLATSHRRFTRTLRICVLSAVLLPALLLYSPLGTHVLTAWLLAQLPPPTTATPSVAVLVGRPLIAPATTAVAADLERQGLVQLIYVSGDERATAERLVTLGVPPARVAGDHCARTTWENATRTTAWLRQQNPGAPLPAISLITDPWQLTRATQAFRRQGLEVKPLAVPVTHLSAATQNRIALREVAALLLYRLQGRD